MGRDRWLCLKQCYRESRVEPTGLYDKAVPDALGRDTNRKPSVIDESEDDLKSELNVEWFARPQSGIIQRVHRASDAPETRVAEEVICPAQVEDVEHIEHFGPELHLHPFCDGSILDHRKINSLEARIVELVSLGVS